MSNFAGLSDYSLWLDWVYYIWQEYDLHDTTSQPRTHSARRFPSLWVTCMRRAPAQSLGFRLWRSTGKAWGHVTASFLSIFLQRWMTAMACFFCFIYYDFSAKKKKDCLLERSKYHSRFVFSNLYLLSFNQLLYVFIFVAEFVKLYLFDAISQW